MLAFHRWRRRRAADGANVGVENNQYNIKYQMITLVKINVIFWCIASNWGSRMDGAVVAGGGMGQLDVDLRACACSTVVRCGGLSAAQAELNVGQSTISMQVGQLEVRLGARLCERGQAVFA